jgi:uncharacterized membrane protein YcaP (DUF421 family)
MILILKLFIGLFILLVYIHLSGKGSLAPISAIDQVGNVVLGAIIGSTLLDEDQISIAYMIIIPSLWALMMLGLRYYSNNHRGAKNIIDGHSIPLILNGILLSDNFGEAKISIRDLTMLLRQRGYTSINELNNVWYEYNGQLTVVKKGEKNVAVVVIENGQILNDSLKMLELPESCLMEELRKHNHELKDIFCGEWHEDRLFIYLYHKINTKAVSTD